MSGKPTKRNHPPTRRIAGYDSVLSGVVELLESARRASVRTVNAIMTASYWEVGRRIVEYEQAGADRAKYGERLLDLLAADLTLRLGRGFGRENLRLMRAFYQCWSTSTISQTPSGKSIREIAARFPLPWSHYVRLLSVENENVRSWA